MRITAIILLFLVALNALAAGYSFMVEPSGTGLGMTTDYLRDSAPFVNFFIPGLILFVVIGLNSIIIGFYTLSKKNHFEYALMFQGCIITGWIAVQITMVNILHPLHFIICSIGIILIICGYKLQKKKQQIIQ